MHFFKIFKQVACRKNVINKMEKKCWRSTTDVLTTEVCGTAKFFFFWGGGYEIGNKKVQKPLVA